MPHLLVVDIDDATLAAIEELMHRRALFPASVQCNLDGEKLRDLAQNGGAPTTTLSAAPAPTIPAINTPEELGIKDTVQSTSDIVPPAFRVNGFAPSPVESRTLIFACWHLDLARHELRTTDETLVPLSHAEFELLYVLAKHP